MNTNSKRHNVLLFLALFLGGLIVSTSELLAQDNVINVVVRAKSLGKKMKEVTYTLYLNEEEVLETVSPKGGFEFIIQPDDGTYKLTIEKGGYITKEIFFNSFDYPFDKNYHIQEIDIEMLPEETVNEEIIQGKMVYSPARRGYMINKIDTMPEFLRKQVAAQALTIDRAYDKAIKYGDALALLGEYEYARGYYDVAAELKPTDSYALKQLAEMEILAAEKEKEEAKVIREQVREYYSVQVGAFLKPFKKEVFDVCPNKRFISGQDQWARVITGEFYTRKEARAHMNEMRNLGFHDAFVVTMRGGVRIGF